MDLPNPPYASDVHAKGWRLELDLGAWERSNSWTLLSESERPFLLMMLWQAWRQLPCGTLPESDVLLSRLAGLDAGRWLALKPRLLSEWFLAADHRYYHPLMIERVKGMLHVRKDASIRQARFRSRSTQIRSRNAMDRNEDIDRWLATLPPERALALRDELAGACAAGHTIVAPLQWLTEVHARWEEAGRVTYRYGEAERARRLAHMPTPETACAESLPDPEESRKFFAELKEQLQQKKS